MDTPNTSKPAGDEKIISGTLTLGWGTLHDCTFCGALESALAATAHPYDYVTLMGVSALAFRMRWWAGHLGHPMFCMSSPVGEMMQEHLLISRATGWKMESVTRFGPPSPMVDQQQAIVQSIDQGLPVIVYHPRLDCAVLHGYRKKGESLLVRDYYGGPEGTTTTIDQLGPQITYFREHQEPITPLNAAIMGVKMAVSQWYRADGGPGSAKGQYLYGTVAYAAWINALSRAEALTDADRKLLFQVNWWNFSSLVDARSAAGRYLRNIVGLLPEPARQSLLAAAEVYDQSVAKMGQVFQTQDIFTGPWTGKTINDWTQSTRRQEQILLHDLLALDEKAIAHLRRAVMSIAPEPSAMESMAKPEAQCNPELRSRSVHKPAKPVRIPPPKMA